uniref:Uncharacterized protein n=1 Tax=Globodera rostochiensis TaxID=31243 RepID=A0A914H4Q0_GLORO
MERQFLSETNFIAKNDGIEKLFEKYGSTLYKRLTVKIIDIVTLNSLLKTERKQYYNELLFNLNEDKVSPRRFIRSPPECGAVMEKAKQFACCWMPKQSDKNACFVNNTLDNGYKHKKMPAHRWLHWFCALVDCRSNWQHSICDNW